MHAETMSIKCSCYFDLKTLMSVITEERVLGAVLSFVIAAPLSNRINLVQLDLGLTVNRRIATSFAGDDLKHFALQPRCDREHIDRAVHLYSRILDRMLLAANGRSKAGIEELFNLDTLARDHLMSHEFEAEVVQITYVALGTQ